MAQSSAVIRRFQFSTSQALAIEIGQYYMRFYKNGSIINVSGTSDPYILETPYLGEEVFSLYMQQINDIVYICHPDHPPYKLMRFADDNWDLQEVDITYPAFLTQNTDDSITIAASGVIGEVTLTASSSIFNADMVGGYFRIGHNREASDLTIALTGNGTSTSINVLGDYEVNTFGNWGAKLKLQQSDDGGVTWRTIRIYESVWDSATSTGSNNFTVPGNVKLQAKFRLVVSDYVNSVAGAKATLTSMSALVWGVVKITGVTNPLTAAATVVEGLDSTDATYWWAEGAWSRNRGFPRCVCMHEQRIIYGGTYYQPSTFWGSCSGDFDNFDTGNGADGDSFTFQIAGKELNEIQWFVSQTSLIVGTSGAVHRVKGDNTGKNITPTQVDIQLQEEIGSEHIQPVVVDGAIIFVSRKGKKLMELVYSYEVERFSARDLTLKSAHLFEDGIRAIEYQYDPIPTIWAVTNDGALCGLAYNRDEEVLGWAKHTTDGEFESVASIYGASNANDELWVIVKRVIQYLDLRSVERMNPAIWEDLEDGFFVDAGITYSGAATGTITGLDHLNDKTVVALADGVVYEGLVVTAGQVTLPGSATASTIHVGLPYTSELQPFRLDTDSTIGQSMGRVKRIGGLHLRLQDSADFTYEWNGTDVEHDLGTDIFSGDAPIDYNTNSDLDPSITIKQSKPLPLGIQAIVVSYEVTGNL